MNTKNEKLMMTMMTWESHAGSGWAVLPWTGGLSWSASEPSALWPLLRTERLRFPSTRSVSSCEEKPLRWPMTTPKICISYHGVNPPQSCCRSYSRVQQPKQLPPHILRHWKVLHFTHTCDCRVDSLNQSGERCLDWSKILLPVRAGSGLQRQADNIPTAHFAP